MKPRNWIRVRVLPSGLWCCKGDHGRTNWWGGRLTKEYGAGGPEYLAHHIREVH